MPPNAAQRQETKKKENNAEIVSTYLGSEPRGPGHGWQTYTRRLSEFLVAMLMLTLIPFVLIPMCSVLRKRGPKRSIETYGKN